MGESKAVLDDTPKLRVGDTVHSHKLVKTAEVVGITEFHDSSGAVRVYWIRWNDNYTGRTLIREHQLDQWALTRGIIDTDGYDQ